MLLNRNNFRRLAFYGCFLLVIFLLTSALYLLVWDYGVENSWKSRHYPEAGFNFYQGLGWFIAKYEVSTDEIIFRPLTYYPPVVPAIYGGLMFLGLPAVQIPTLVVLLTWPLFLFGLALLTYRLSRSRSMAIWIMILAGVTWPYLTVYTRTGSEATFLTLLVFLSLILVDLPHKENRPLFWLFMATILIALLMLTRYVGIFFYAATGLWWMGWRIKQKRVRLLVGELAILVLAAVPFLAWVGRNFSLTGHPFGTKHLGSHPGYTFTDTLTELLQHSSWIFLPAVRPGPVWRALGWPALLACVGIGAAGAYLIWRYRPKPWIRMLLLHSPLAIFVGVYFGIFIFVQPFIYINPMSARYMTVALCLVQPWFLILLARSPARWSNAFMVGYVALNLTLVIALSTARGVPHWIKVAPPDFDDLANHHQEAWDYLNSGMPAWLLHRPPRLNDLSNHHREVAAFLDSLAPEAAIVSNAPDLFLYRPVAALGTPVSHWLAEGKCVSRHEVVVIVFDWDRWSEGIIDNTYQAKELKPEQLAYEIEQKCPEATKQVFTYAVVYYVPQQTAIDSAQTK